jgi:hypothetical protein
LIAGAIEQNLAFEHAGRTELDAALDVARAQFGSQRAARRLLVLSDGIGFATSRGVPMRKLEQLARQIGAANVLVLATTERAALPVAPFVRAGGDLDARAQVLRDWLAPAPARVLEASGADVEWGLERDVVPLGDFNLGESRTEMLRVSLPNWVSGQPFTLRFRARYRAHGQTAYSRSRATLGLRYTDDIEVLGDRRHGDVIAYASALAMVRRLERVFQGSDVERLGGLEGTVLWQAKGLDLLAKSSGDRSLADQAELLRTLVRATR